MERLLGLRSERTDLVRAAVTAAWRWATAHVLAIGYISADDPESRLEKLLALRRMVSVLTDEQADRLTEAVFGGADRDQFVRALHDGIALGNAWANGLTGRAPQPETTDPLAAALAAAAQTTGSAPAPRFEEATGAIATTPFAYSTRWTPLKMTEPVYVSPDRVVGTQINGAPHLGTAPRLPHPVSVRRETS